MHCLELGLLTKFENVHLHNCFSYCAAQTSSNWKSLAVCIYKLTVGETGEFANRFTGLKKKRLTGLPVSYTCTLYMYFAQALTIPFVVTSQQPIQQPIPSAYIIICVLDTVKPTKFVPDIYFFPHSLILWKVSSLCVRKGRRRVVTQAAATAGFHR